MLSKKLGKRFLAGALAFAVALVGFTYVPKNAQAVENSPVKYQKVSLKDFKDKVGTTAPTYVPDDATDNTGYLFAGWYEIGDNDAVGDVIATADGITAEQVYAKFVPSYLAGIACQVDLNQDADKRNMRVVSLVHSQDYIAAGFNVYGRYDADVVKDGINETEWVMYKYWFVAQGESEKINANELLAKQVGESRMTIQRYIRLTNLIPKVLDMVDEGKIAFTVAVELSYLTEEQQYELYEVMNIEQCTPSLSQANRMKRLSQSGELDMELIFQILEQEKPNQREVIKIPADVLQIYIPKEYTPREKVELIERLVMEWYETRDKNEKERKQ